MSAVSAGGGSKRTLAIVLGAIGVVFVILAILFFAGVSMGPLTTMLHSGSKVSTGSHDKRGIVAAVVGVIALAAAWITSKRN